MPVPHPLAPHVQRVHDAHAHAHAEAHATADAEHAKAEQRRADAPPLPTSPDDGPTQEGTDHE